MKIPIQIEDCDGFGEEVVNVTNLLGSDLPADYQAVRTWMKESKHMGDEMFLAAMFRVDGGVLSTDSVTAS